MRILRSLAIAAVASTGAPAGAITVTLSHPYGEMVERGNVVVAVQPGSPWNCTSTVDVDKAGRRITLTGGAAPSGETIVCAAPWTATLPPLAPGAYEVRAALVAGGGSVVESVVQPFEILPMGGRCNPDPSQMTPVSAQHKTLSPAQLADRLLHEPGYAASLGDAAVLNTAATGVDAPAQLLFPPLVDVPISMDRLVASGEFQWVHRNGYTCFSAAPPDATQTFVEFYHAGLDHYFYTGDAGEIAAIEAGKVGAWVRTGQWFRAVTQPGCEFSTTDSAVYRFAGRPGKGPSSHFFTRDRAECYAVDRSGQWDFEGQPMWATPVSADGTCSAPYAQNRVPLYRVWRPFGDSNHRFSTKRAIVDEMVAKGWVDEGAAMCVLPDKQE